MPQQNQMCTQNHTVLTKKKDKRKYIGSFKYFKSCNTKN